MALTIINAKDKKGKQKKQSGLTGACLYDTPLRGLVETGS